MTKNYNFCYLNLYSFIKNILWTLL
jgi:hypothetical protein